MSDPHHLASGLTDDQLDLSADRSTAEKLPLPQATALVITLSLGLWSLIALGIRWLIA